MGNRVKLDGTLLAMTFTELVACSDKPAGTAPTLAPMPVGGTPNFTRVVVDAANAGDCLSLIHI